MLYQTKVYALVTALSGRPTELPSLTTGGR